MRKDVIGRNLTWPEQQALAMERGLELPDQLSRVLFSCLGHVRSGTANTYPDRENPWTYARTATMTTTQTGESLPLGCGDSPPFSLNCLITGASVEVGVAVALPEKVQGTLS